MRIKFPNRLVLSAMAGVNNAQFCKQHPVGMAILGGFNTDSASNHAAREVEKRGRKEFILDDPREEIELEVKTFLDFNQNQNFSLNIRSATLEGYIVAAEIAKKYGGLLEINAHCRQPEFIEAKCGQWLMYHPKELTSLLREVSQCGAPVGVKLRGGISQVDYLHLSRELKRNGCSFIHLDAMIEGGGCDLKLISELANECFVIGNNSVVDIESGERILSCGAKLVSAARAALKDSDFFEKMLGSSELKEPLEVDLGI